MIRIRLAATLAVVAMATGCAVLPQPPEPIPNFVPPIDPDWEPTGVPITVDGFSPVQRIALRVRTESCTEFGTGSAWVLDANTAVTNSHVVEDTIDVEVTSYDGITYNVTSMVVTDAADLALLTIDGEFPEFATIAAQEPSIGDTLTVVGFPEGSRLTIDSGRFTSRIPDSLEENDMDVYAFMAPAKPGNSGSPITNENNEVVGVLYATNEFGTSYAVSLTALLEFLEDESSHRAVNNSC